MLPTLWQRGFSSHFLRMMGGGGERKKGFREERVMGPFNMVAGSLDGKN